MARSTRNSIWAAVGTGLLLWFLLLLLSSHAAARDTGCLKLWHSYRGDERAALDELIREWNGKHPELRVEPLALPYDAYANKLTSAIPRGHGPDLFISAHERIGDWAESGLGDELVGRIESFFRGIGVETANVDELFFHQWMDTRYADLLAIFGRCGYEWIWQEHELDGDIYKDLQDFTLRDWIIQARESLANEGITFGFCEPQFRQAYLEFMDTHLTGYEGWRQMAREYVDGEGDPRLRILAFRGDEVMGFTQLAKETSWYIAATGVREELRRKRIGPVLVYLAL